MLYSTTQMQFLCHTHTSVKGVNRTACGTEIGCVSASKIASASSIGSASKIVDTSKSQVHAILLTKTFPISTYKVIS